jgi:hypothetical protein
MRQEIVNSDNGTYAEAAQLRVMNGRNKRWLLVMNDVDVA